MQKAAAASCFLFYSDNITVGKNWLFSFCCTIYVIWFYYNPETGAWSNFVGKIKVNLFWTVLTDKVCTVNPFSFVVRNITFFIYWRKKQTACWSSKFKTLALQNDAFSCCKNWTFFSCKPVNDFCDGRSCVRDYNFSDRNIGKMRYLVNTKFLQV